MKKVLIITYYWPPGGGSGVQRWLKMSGYLPEFGWEPHVLTVRNPEYQLEDKTLHQEASGKVKVFRESAFDPNTWYTRWFGNRIGKANIGFTSGQKESRLFRLVKWIRGNMFIPDSRVFWVNKAVQTALRLHSEYGYEAVITTGPPHSLHLAGQRIQQKTGLRWVADFRDPWTDIYYFDELLPTARTRRKHLRLETGVLKQADCIVVVGKTMKSMFAHRTDKPIHIIPNGYDHADFESCPVAHQYDPTTFCISYVGVLSPSQNPEVLWSVLGEMVRADSAFSAALRLRLTGAIDHSALSSIERHGLSGHMVIQPYLPHQQAIAEQIRADVLLLCINRVRHAEYLLTGKLFEYIGSGRPVLCIGPVLGDAAAALTQAQAGSTFDFEDREGIRRQLQQWFSTHQHQEIAAPGDPDRVFSRQNLALAYSGVLNGKD